MQSFDKKISDFKDSNFISVFYEFGMTPDDIKTAIIDGLDSYFENKYNLHKYATSDLVNPLLIHLTLYRDYPELLKFLDKIIAIFHDAKRVDTERTIAAFVTWLPEMNNSISRFWSLFNSQFNILDLSIEDFSAEALNGIGQSIEGLSKSFFKLVLHVNRIARRKSVDFQEIYSKDLGVVIDELIATAELQDFLTLPPNKIRLNQWRNIAYHHNSRTANGKIYCSFKKNGIQEEFEVTKDELIDVLRRCMAIYKVLRFCESVFCIDNIDKVLAMQSENSSETLDLREEARLLDFYLPISSQGFLVTNFKYDQEYAILDVKDMEEYGDFSKRAIHSSQFLYHLWQFTKSTKLTVNYYLYKGQHFFSSEITSDNFTKDEGAKIEFSEFMAEAKYPFLTLDYRQNLNPFENLNLAKQIKDHPQQFYSQSGENISVEEFANQFILSVFCNYLALQSEGFKDIKINIGSEGSLQVTEKPKKLVFHVPALIQSKELQLALIDLLDIVINAYEDMILKKDLVDQAKANNNYFYKKSVIRLQLKETGEDTDNTLS